MNEQQLDLLEHAVKICRDGGNDDLCESKLVTEDRMKSYYKGREVGARLAANTFERAIEGAKELE